MNEKQLKRLIREGLSPCGAGPIDLELLYQLVPLVEKRGHYVRSMETFQKISDDRRPLRVDLSILGLESGFDSLAADTPGVASNLVRAKADLARKEGATFEFVVWLDNLRSDA